MLKVLARPVLAIPGLHAFPGLPPNVVVCFDSHKFVLRVFTWVLVWPFKIATKSQNFGIDLCQVLLLKTQPVFGKCTCADVFNRAIWVLWLGKVSCSHKSFWNEWRYDKFFSTHSLTMASVSVHGMQRCANCLSVWLICTSPRFKHC